MGDRKGEITPKMSSEDNILLSVTPVVKSPSAPEMGAQDVPGRGLGKGSKEPQEGGCRCRHQVIDANVTCTTCSCLPPPILHVGSPRLPGGAGRAQR